MFRTWLASSLILFAVAGSARAADDQPRPGDQSAPRSVEELAGPTRGSILPGLYVSFAALQVYDGYTTLTGFQYGATEMNPVMRGVADRPAAMWALKGASTVAAVYFAERLWRERHRGEAVAVMIVSNVVLATVAAHNASVIRTLK